MELCPFSHQNLSLSMEFRDFGFTGIFSGNMVHTFMIYSVNKNKKMVELVQEWLSSQ